MSDPAATNSVADDAPPLPRGFRAAGLHCGIKTDAAKSDLALFVSDAPAVAAGVFTTNWVCGAPVTLSRGRVPASAVRAVVVNSGNANACTGEAGLADARAATAAVARALGCGEADVLACSTGVIGRPLPMAPLLSGIPRVVEALSDAPAGFADAARAMMTTDTVPKQAIRRFTVDTDGTPAGMRTVTIAGAAKGAAMIAPNMATMLAVVMTDAKIDPARADDLLRAAADQTFNRISVDGHTSTSDTVLLLANGTADMHIGARSRDLSRRHAPGSDGLIAFKTALQEVCAELSEKIIRDAEGATHLIRATVNGLPTEDDALRVARAVAESLLVKTAVAGADPNWGRVVSAAGYAGVAFGEQDLSLSMNGVEVYRAGVPLSIDAAALSALLRERYDTDLTLTFTRGDESAVVLTSDLTAEYVRLNADYTT